MKLYRVRATVDVLVMAEDAFDAEYVASTEATDELKFDVVEAKQTDMPDGWTPRALVYQQSRQADDMTAAEALKGCGP